MTFNMVSFSSVLFVVSSYNINSIVYSTLARVWLDYITNQTILVFRLLLRH